MDGLKMNRRLTDVSIFEMTDCLLVTTRRVQFNCRLLPFQFGARSQAKNERQRKTEDVGFHFLE
jgi:hypothetical protein